MKQGAEEMQAELQDCTCFEGYCAFCNSVYRVVLADELTAVYPCPTCKDSVPLLRLEPVGKGRTTRQLPIAEFLHRGRHLAIDEMVFHGSPRQKRMRYRESLPEAMRAFAGTH